MDASKLNNIYLAIGTGTATDKFMKKDSPQSAGGRARAAKLTDEQRSKIAKIAVKKRWEGIETGGKVGISVTVNQSTLDRAVAKWGKNKSALIEKLLSDYAG